jgi:hypothetical protein
MEVVPRRNAKARGCLKGGKAVGDRRPRFYRLDLVASLNDAGRADVAADHLLGELPRCYWVKFRIFQTASDTPQPFPNIILK